MRVVEVAVNESVGNVFFRGEKPLQLSFAYNIFPIQLIYLFLKFFKSFISVFILYIIIGGRVGFLNIYASCLYGLVRERIVKQLSLGYDMFNVKFLAEQCFTWYIGI